MASTVFPAPSAGGKTMFRTTLTSGTSYTVPAGVTYLNVTLYGGGGGGAGSGYASYSNPAGAGGVGGTTSFTGAVSAIGGNGGGVSHKGENMVGVAAGANSYQGGSGGKISGGQGTISDTGFIGQIVSSTLSATAGATIAYAIGAGGGGGSNSESSGGSGGSGKIDIEYWV